MTPLTIGLDLLDPSSARRRDRGRLRRPRWFYRLHAHLGGYFWLPCPVCRRPFSGWEGGRDRLFAPASFDGLSGGRLVCSRACAIEGALIVALGDPAGALR